MPSHDFNDHDALVGFGCGVEPVDGFGHDLHGGIESERVVRTGEVVVDGLWNTDNRIAFLLEKPMRDTQSILATDGYERVQAILLPIRLKLLKMFDLFKWISSGCAQNRAASRKDAGDGKIR